MKKDSQTTFIFSEKSLKKLDKLVEITDSLDRTDVIKNALKLYESTANTCRELEETLSNEA